MIVLVTGRRVMMVHGKADGRANPSSAAARHSYGLVEWEVDFGLVICLETDEQEGRANPVRAPSARQQLRARGERSDGDGGDGDGDDSETCLWLYHVPDLCEEANGLDGGRRMGELDGHQHGWLGHMPCRMRRAIFLSPAGNGGSSLPVYRWRSVLLQVFRVVVLFFDLLS